MIKCKYCNSEEYPVGESGICTDCARCGVTVNTLESDDQAELDNLIAVEDELAALQTGDYLMIVPDLDRPEFEPYKYLVRVIGRQADGELSLEKYSHKYPQWIPVNIEQIRPVYTVIPSDVAAAYLAGKSFEATIFGGVDATT
jgi:hypothetical protein